MTHKVTPRPVLKWAGGKTQLLAQYEPYWPKDFQGYLEPFAGGAAVFFWLWRQGRLAEGWPVILSDANPELINCYQVIKHTPLELLSELHEHERWFTPGDDAYYYHVRDWDREPGYACMPAAKRAARMIFLNKTCFNGLYRVNSQGQFNVPIGDHRTVRIADDTNIWAVHWALKDENANLLCDDFSCCLNWAIPGDLVYLDPPYYPTSKTANFTSYTPGAFGPEEHLRLAGIVRELDDLGCLVVLSNADVPAIRDLYQDYRIVTVKARRAINRNGGSRGEISELLILNYD